MTVKTKKKVIHESATPQVEPNAPVVTFSTAVLHDSKLIACDNCIGGLTHVTGIEDFVLCDKCKGRGLKEEALG